MALEIRHNRADHTHENEQFRRIAISLKLLFKQRNWSGLLIGNPFNENYSRFRADAILLYDHGLVIIDLKDYKGTIKLPPNEQEFKIAKWYSESDVDKQRIEIKAGARFINPFRQLSSYRDSMFEIIKNSIVLNSNIKANRVCALNIFTGPITLLYQVPRNIPYYKLVQEKDLSTFLYDFSSENTYDADSADALKSIFDASLWDEKIEVPLHFVQKQPVIEIDSDVESEITNFLQEKTSGILVLESMHAQDRDNWMRYVLSEAVEYAVPQTEVWTHSLRVSKKLTDRTGVSVNGLFGRIYGGTDTLVSNNENEENSSDLQEIVNIRPDNLIDESAVIILHEAHLISRSLYQSELLKFGSGRLLEDLMKFLSLDNTKRKLICIGDPYSLSYGKPEESAVNMETLGSLFNGKIRHHKQQLKIIGNGGKFNLRTNLARNIERNIFNTLDYNWIEEDMIHVNKDKATDLLYNWFKEPLFSEPRNCCLVYTNKDAKKINLWVKNKCLNNGSSLAPNDLLMVHNTVHIPDHTGFGQPTNLTNGMYLLVKAKHETKDEPVIIRQSKTPINLSFTRLTVSCLSVTNKPETDLWILNNYFLNEDQLSKNEEIALQVFISKMIDENIRKHPFINSEEHIKLLQSPAYLALSKEEQLAIEYLVNEKGATTTAAARSLLSKYRKLYRSTVLQMVAQQNPFVNAVKVSYAWAITVNKALGATFSNVLINAYQGENRGISNSSYNRWLYSALTTSRQIAFIANPQTVHPLIDCDFEETSNTEEISRREALLFPGYEVVEKYNDLISDTLNEHVRGAISEFSLFMESKGAFLRSVRPSGAYMTKAEYSLTGKPESLIMIFSNNGTGSVTSIRVERSGGLSENTINESIETLFSTAGRASKSTVLELPMDFRQEVYQNWALTLKQKGFDMQLKGSHKYHDIIEASNGDQNFKFRVYYNDRGFFTKITILEKSTIDLSQSVKGWLLNLN
ncbi:hypothetical protein K3G39_07030 [Pontibacter sp. HSC-14F20]|uniref:hypothetical protein n=1 Tax=Pontibacter sp. HSC-14F20 TaxID=2864136 RepID=UPI001C7366F3|nr:hypothetical protein [Pontibacter sp. HSC-14F20]MBX0332987.1 hypothetical protein [Pontibacter sp. HSC-14F20]